ncbi:MAG: hypothetical protein CR997_12370 [Acidobacteria bacterium]|nr:MAG: hypothetical protein CR997_12370 [Acidobacteriota bacterium]
MRKHLVLFMIFCTPVLAGWTFLTETRTSDDKGQVTQKTIVKSMVDGTNGKFIFQESTDSPIAATGNYLLTNDGGQTIYLVDPVNKTYSLFHISQMLKTAGTMMNMVQGVVKMEFSEPEITILEEKKGKAIQGLPTDYRKSVTSYEMKMKVLGIKRVLDVKTTEESWTTKQFTDTAFSAWLRKDPAPTGNEELDRIIRAATEQVEGYPLKLIQTNQTTTWNKKKTKVKDKTTTTTVMAVTQLKQETIEPSQFVIPDTYVQSENQQPNGMSNLKDIFNQ